VPSAQLARWWAWFALVSARTLCPRGITPREFRLRAPPQPARVKRIREKKRRDGKPQRSAVDLADEREDDKQDLSDEH